MSLNTKLENCPPVFSASNRVSQKLSPLSFSRISIFALRVSSPVLGHLSPQSRIINHAITPLECALTSHFAPEFDLKSFRMRTYVTPGGRGGTRAYARKLLIINYLTLTHLVPVPRPSALNFRYRTLAPEVREPRASQITAHQLRAQKDEVSHGHSCYNSSSQ